MKHTITIYIADRTKNAILSSMEGDSTKILCFPQDISVEPKEGELVDEKLFRKMMEQSKQIGDCWVAAISYMNNFFKENEDSIIITDSPVKWACES